MPAYEAPVAAPTWIELFTSDRDRATAFYGELLGWDHEEPNEDVGGYLNFTLDGVRIAGLMQSQQEPGHPVDFWNTYLRTDDIEATVAAAEAAGSPVLLPPHPVGDLGHFAMVADTGGGAAVGLWQPGTHRGFGRYAEVGAPQWFELHADRHAETVAWYEQVMGWAPVEMSDDPGFRYTRQPGPAGAEADDWVAAIMDTEGSRPDGVPPSWKIYFVVADTDDALATVERFGGSVLDGPEDTPFGRLAEVADQMGAAFKIGQPT